MSPDELAKLLEAARRAHEGRREYERRRRLLEIEVAARAGTAREREPGRRAGARARRRAARRRRGASGLRAPARAAPRGRATPPRPSSARTRSAAKWRELVERYVHEAQGAADSAFRSSLLVSAAEVDATGSAAARRRRRSPGAGRADRRAPARRAARSIRRTGAPRCCSSACSATTGRWDDARRGARAASRARRRRRTRRSPAGCGSRASSRRSSSRPTRAAAAYERVLDVVARQRGGDELPRRITSRRARCGSTSWRSTRGSSSTGALRGKEEEFGAIAAGRDGPLAHARAARGRGAVVRAPSQARAGAPGDAARSSASGARRAARTRASRRSSPTRSARCPTARSARRIAAEIAKLAEEGANAQKAIEQWRAVLRQDPRNKDARDALKRLYRADGELERADRPAAPGARASSPPDDAAGRLAVLRDIARRLPRRT